MVGNYKDDLLGPEGSERDGEIAVALEQEILEDLSAHFLSLQRPWTRYGKTWSMVWPRKEMWSRMDYILGADFRLFKKMSVWDHIHNSDHYLILGDLHRSTLREHA